MQVEPQRHEEIVYRADPFTFIFRELDLIREDIRGLREEIKRINERIDHLNSEVNKRLDRLFLLVIINLLGIVAFLIKVLFF